MSPELQTNKKSALHSLFSYLLAAFTGVLGLLNWLTMRTLVLDLLVNSSIKKEAWRAVDSFTFAAFGILWLLVILFSQYYYRKGFRKKKAGHRFLLFTGIQLLLLAVCEIIPLILGVTKWGLAETMYILGECILGVGFITLTIRISFKSKTDLSS